MHDFQQTSHPFVWSHPGQKKGHKVSSASHKVGRIPVDTSDICRWRLLQVKGTSSDIRLGLKLHLKNHKTSTFIFSFIIVFVVFSCCCCWRCDPSHSTISSTSSNFMVKGATDSPSSLVPSPKTLREVLLWRQKQSKNSGQTSPCSNHTRSLYIERNVWIWMFQKWSNAETMFTPPDI